VLVCTKIVLLKESKERLVQLFVGVKASINCSSQILYLGLYNELIFFKYYTLPWSNSCTIVCVRRMSCHAYKLKYILPSKNWPI